MNIKRIEDLNNRVKELEAAICKFIKSEEESANCYCCEDHGQPHKKDCLVVEFKGLLKK